jgi:hypothetical protein
MDERRCARLVTCFLFGILSLATTNTGCALSEAILDGVYGGISDTVAAIVSEATLGAVSSGAS